MASFRNLLYFSILLGSTLICQSARLNSSIVDKKTTEREPDEKQDTNKTAYEIEALQKEKDDLYDKINKAIDEAIPELEKTNDTDALTGLEQIKTLKDQIKLIHEASDSDESEVNSTDMRRSFSITVDRESKSKAVDWKAKQKKQKDDFYEKLIKSRDKRYTSIPKVLNREKVKKQIEEWLQKKAEEKRKRNELKAKTQIELEKCPNYGQGKEKKMAGSSKKKKKKSRYYPCCRKCCKKSYLGCL